MNSYLDKFRTWIILHLPKEELNAFRKIQFTIVTNFWNTVPVNLNNNRPPTLSKRLNGIVFRDCAWWSKRRFTYPAFKDLSIISKSGMLSPLSFILPIIVERLILGGLWFHVKLDRDLLTWSTKPAGTLRTEQMKIIFERAKLFIIVTFPKSVKSLEDQTLRHSFQGDKLFFKVVLCWSFRIAWERNAKASYALRGPVYIEKVCRLWSLVFPNNNASVFDLFRSNAQHPLKACNFSNSFSTDFSSRTKHEVSSAYWDNLYSLPLKFIPVINLSFLIAAITKQLQSNYKVCTRKRAALPYTAL